MLILERGGSFTSVLVQYSKLKTGLNTQVVYFWKSEIFSSNFNWIGLNHLQFWTFTCCAYILGQIQCFNFICICKLLLKEMLVLFIDMSIEEVKIYQIKHDFFSVGVK